MQTTVQIYARARGTLEWMCPNCQHMQSVRAPWRKAWIHCRRLACRHKFRTGITFNSTVWGHLPTEACWTPRWNNQTVNGLDVIGDYSLTARWVGSIDWCCPKCTHPQSSSPDWDKGSITCADCVASYAVRVILYPAKQHLAVKPPIDWITQPYVQENRHVTPSAEVTQSA